MRIAFDMDGVLADLHAAYVSAALALFPDLDRTALEDAPARDAIRLGGADAAGDAAPEEAAPGPEPSGGPVAGERPETLAGVKLSRRQSEAVWDRLSAQTDFWETLAEIESGAVARLARVAADRRWDVLFITSRPRSAGGTIQRQTQRWLQRHGFDLPSAYVVHGSRGRVAEALELDVVVDDRPDNCLDVVLESKAGAVLIWRGAAASVPGSARRLGIAVAHSVNECLDAIVAAESEGSDGTFLDRLRGLFGVRTKNGSGLLRRNSGSA
jgi:hypothetical protein